VNPDILRRGEAQIDLMIAGVCLARSSHGAELTSSLRHAAKAQRASGSGAVLNRAPASDRGSAAIKSFC